MKLFDRLNQQLVSLEVIKNPVIFSRYLDENNNFLVPTFDLQEKISESVEIQFIENFFINNSSLLSNSFIEIANEFSKIDSFSDIRDINTMLRNFDEKLEINDYDKFIANMLFHIEEICRQPSYYLSREVTKVNISRAKRISVKSINYLASHSEDWIRRQIRGVIPKSILSETIEYDLKIYENKVTSKLIDKLLIYCSNRIINDIELVEKLIQKVDLILKDIEAQDEKANVWYKKRERDYSKIGAIVEKANDSKRSLKQLKDHIIKIQNRLFGLLTSDLYIENKNTVLASDTIERTNLFDNHQHYRFVKIIWNKSFQIKILDCNETRKNNLLVINSFISFSYLLILKSFLEIGFEQKKINAEDSFLLNHKQYAFDVLIEKNQKNIITIEMCNEKIYFIPILCKEPLPIVMDEINIFYLVPSKVGDNNCKRIITISPDDINGEERITKVIFEYVLKYYVTSYLYHLNDQLISQFSILKDWMLKNNDLVVNIGMGDRIDLYVKKYMEHSHITEFEASIEKQKNNLPNYQTRNQQLKDIDFIRKQFLDSQDHFEKYFICLGCGNKNIRSLESTNNSFIYTCKNNGCEVSYGKRESGIFYEVKNLQTIKGDLEDKIGYENI